MALAPFALTAFNTTNVLVWIIIGLIAGFLATRVVRGSHFGVIGDIVIGLVGAFLAGLILDFLLPNLHLGFFGEIIAAFFGAVVLLALLHLVVGQRRRRR